MKKFCFLFIILLYVGIAIAQVPVEVDRREFKLENKPDGFKDAWRNINDGDKYFVNGPMYYAPALDFYLKAYEYNPDNAELNYKIGLCYLKTTERIKAKSFLEKAYELKKQVSADILYQLGIAYHISADYEKAISMFKQFKATLPPDDYERFKELVADPDRLILQCQTAERLSANPQRAFIDNLGKSVNTRFPEYNAVITPDESVMYFTGRRPNTTGGAKDPIDGLYYEDVYVSYNYSGEWSAPLNLGKPINRDDHDAVAGISPDGQTLIIYKGSVNGGDLLICHLGEDGWSRPKSLSKEINSKYHEPSASLAPDGRSLFFSSNRKHNKRIANYGKHDIYLSLVDDKGEWSDPLNLGNVINTPYDEDAPFIHPDGRTLYFSSNGHKGMGGYDIFRSVRQNDGSWSKPENLGAPINTPGDDIFLVVSADGRHAYFSSSKAGGHGQADIYRITFLGPEKPSLQSNEDNLIASLEQPIKEKVVEKEIKIKRTYLTLLKGSVTDSISHKPVSANIDLVDLTTNKLISTFKSQPKNGRYLIALPSGHNYSITVDHPDYLFVSENFNIPETQGYQEVIKDFALLNISVGSKVILKNIFFDTAKSNLRPESTPELTRLLKLLNNYPSMHIEISGHTDNRGGLEYNKKLSRDRAEAVVNYLIENGISNDRLKYAGYAYEHPIASNDTAEGRQMNRRVEFKIIKR